MRIIRKKSTKQFSKPVSSIRKRKFARDGRTVEVASDHFLEWCLERTQEWPANQSGLSEEFWKEALEFFADIGWMSDPWDNDPSYIVDNIAVNGEIIDLEEDLEEHFNEKELKEIKEDYNGDIEEYAADKGYDIIDNMLVINWGL